MGYRSINLLDLLGRNNDLFDVIKESTIDVEQSTLPLFLEVIPF